MDLVLLWEKSLAQYPTRVAVAGAGQQATYQELGAYIRKAAELLHRVGVRRGVKVALFFPNEPDFLVAFFAILSLGGIACPLNPNLTVPELDQILQVVDPDLAIAGAIPATLREHLDCKLPILDLTAWQLKDTDKQIQPKDPEAELKDVACILCTSGTTGLPKAAMLTHQNLASNTNALWANKRWLEFEVFGNALPVFHIYGITVLTLLPLAMGGKVVFMPRFSPESCLKTIQQQRITRFGGVPSMFAMLNKYRKPDQFDISACQSWISGGAPLPGAVVEEFAEKFGSFIYEGYGMLETSPGISWNLDDRSYHRGAVGRPLKGIEVEIRDEKGDRVEIGQPGEIYVRGSGIMKGYYRNPQATSETIQNRWLMTGDIGRFDVEGYLYLMGRKKELMIVGGHNVYPREIETVLLEDAAVSDVAVAAQADPVRGEQILAFIVPVSGSKISEKALIDRCRHQLSPFKVPRKVYVLPQLPRNDSGKVMRHQLLALVEQSSGAIANFQPALCTQGN